MVPRRRETELQWNGTGWSLATNPDSIPSSDNNHVRVWRPRVERLNPAFALQQHTAPIAGVMVWGTIAYNTRSPLILIRGTMASQPYVHDILQPHVLPLFSRLPGAIFQQDNVRPHTAKVSQDSPHCYPPSFFCPIGAYLESFGSASRASHEFERTRCKYGTKCLKTSDRTCMPQCLIISHRAFAVEGIQQVIESLTKCEIQSVIRFFLIARNMSAADIHRQITEVYATEAMSDSEVRKWVRKFKDGRTNVHVEER
ncbi:transposable element Tcb2 transposase [Trichonephila clavipes]|nr:transposable element Tcb2 transposase [Trichonephila clavipes]